MGQPDLKLNVWDLGGATHIRPYWSNYYEEDDSHGPVIALVYVIDSSDNERLDEAAEELKKVLEDERLRDAPLLVLANKQDLPAATSVSGIKAMLKVATGTREQVPVRPCSATT